MNKLGVIGIVAASLTTVGVVTFVLVKRRPQISVESTDWMKKEAHVIMKAGKAMSEKIYHLGDSGNAGGSGYELNMATSGQTMIFTIKKSGQIKKQTVIDFSKSTKTIIK